mgnify:CR=1 FL=1
MNVPCVWRPAAYRGEDVAWWLCSVGRFHLWSADKGAPPASAHIPLADQNATYSEGFAEGLRVAAQIAEEPWFSAEGKVVAIAIRQVRDGIGGIRNEG